MKICEEYAALLDMYADGFCTDEETAQVRRHLAECPVCRAYVEEILLMRAAFPDAEETEVPEGFAEGVMAAIRAEAVPRKKRTTVWKRALLPVAACLTLVVALRLMPFAGRGGSAAQEASMAMDYFYSGTTAWDAEKSLPGGTVYDASPAENENGASKPAVEESVADAKEEPAPAVREVSVKLTRQQIETILNGFEGAEENGAIVYKLTAAEFDAVLAKLPADMFVPAFDPAMEGTPGVLTVYPTE